MPIRTFIVTAIASLGITGTGLFTISTFSSGEQSFASSSPLVVLTVLVYLIDLTTPICTFFRLHISLLQNIMMSTWYGNKEASFAQLLNVI